MMHFNKDSQTKMGIKH